MNLLDRIRSLNVQIAELDSHIAQSIVERSMLEHIDDDAQRDAAVSQMYDDRAAAKMTRSDVERMSSHIDDTERTRARLVTKRDKLVSKLVDG